MDSPESLNAERELVQRSYTPPTSLFSCWQSLCLHVSGVMFVQNLLDVGQLYVLSLAV